ncbi:MAG: hypothetical protein U0800_06315 [Isosphaeraceae bacterium]
MDRIVSRVGRRVDETSPMVDAPMPNGSRFNAIILLLALDGAAITIRTSGPSRWARTTCCGSARSRPR